MLKRMSKENSIDMEEKWKAFGLILKAVMYPCQGVGRHFVTKCKCCDIIVRVDKPNFIKIIRCRIQGIVDNSGKDNTLANSASASITCSSLRYALH